MTKRIDVPGVGVIEFPAEMSDEQITNAIRNNIMPKYSARTETPTQTFGRSAASLADTALNTLTGTMDIGARALARAYYGGLRGKSTEEAERLAQSEGTSPKDIVGRAFGVTGTPGYEQAPLRQLGTYAGEAIGQNVIQPLASATGLPEGYVGDVVNLGTAAVAPAIPKVAKVAATPITETAIGFRQGLAQPTYQRGAGSSFVPLQEKFYPAKQVDPFMKATPEQRVAMLPELEASQKPSSSLFTSTPGMLARNLGPKAEGQTLIPYRGETFRAFGEQLARDISERPLTSGGLGLGGAVLGGLVGGIPGALIGGAIAPGVRAGQLGSIAKLGGTARFSRGFPEALAETQGTVGRQMMAPGPVAPQLGYNPNVVIPAGTQPRSVNIEGQSYNLPYQIDTSQAQTARAPQTATPVPDLAQMAAQRSIQEAAKSQNQVHWTAAQQVSGPVDPTGILAQTIAQIRARQNQTKPPPAEPTGGVTVTPTPTGPQPQGGGSLFDPQVFNRSTLSDKDKLASLRAKLNEQPPQTMTPAQERQMRREVNSPKIQIEGVEQQIREIVRGGEVKGGTPTSTMSTASERGQLVPIDPTDLDNATKGMAKKLLANGIGELPNEIPGVITTNQIIRKAYQELTNKYPKKKGPSNISQMKLGEEKFDLGTYDNPAPHKKAMETLNWANLTEPEKLNIVGQSADKTEKYIIRTTPVGKSTLYEYSNPKTKQIELEIERYTMGNESKTTIRDLASGYDYEFNNGTLYLIKNVSEGKYYTQSMPEFEKMKINHIDPMEAILKIKK